MKNCSQCKQYKSESEYAKRKESYDGLCAMCLDCKRKKEKVYARRRYIKKSRSKFGYKPKEKECECGRSIEKEWTTLGSERICLKCKELDEIRAYETSKENLDLMNK